MWNALSSCRSGVAGLGIAALVMGFAAHPALGFSGGPPDGFANEPPGFQNCTLCHSDFALNSGDGAVTITGLPAGFFAGQTYDLTVIVDDPGQERWGFELAVLDGGDGQGGELIVTDVPRTQLSDNAGTSADYLKQTSDGSDLGTLDQTSWSFQWTAPDVPFVTFYVVGNGANGDFGTTGDYVYAAEYPVVQDTGTPVQETTWSAIKDGYR